jgi:hypothetical protein
MPASSDIIVPGIILMAGVLSAAAANTGMASGHQSCDGGDGTSLAEFSSVAIRKAGIEVDAVRTTIDAWRAVLPVQGTEDDDLSAALDAVKNHRLAFWDAVLWAAAQGAGVRHLLSEDLQDGFELAGVRFVNPFEAANNRLIDEVLPPG